VSSLSQDRDFMSKDKQVLKAFLFNSK